MSRIYKYELNITQLQKVSLPIGAKILSVANQNDKLCMWAIVNPQLETVVRIIQILGTGFEITDINNKTFIGTVLMGPLVWHVFEVAN